MLTKRIRPSFLSNRTNTMLTKLIHRKPPNFLISRALHTEKPPVMSKRLIDFGLFATILGATTYLIQKTDNTECLDLTEIDKENVIVKKQIEWLLAKNFDENSIYILIHNAAKQGVMEDIVALCEVAKLSGIDLTYYSTGESALDAIRKGHLDIALYLLEQGAPRRGFLENDLNFAILTGDVHGIKALISTLPRYQHYQEPYGTFISPFHLACRLGYIDVVNLFLADVSTLPAGKMPGNASINFAPFLHLFSTNRITQNIHIKAGIAVDHLACLKSLLKDSRNASNRFEAYDKILAMAVEKNDLNAAIFLIDRGARDRLRVYKKDITHLDPQSLLMLTAEKNWGEMAKILIQKDALQDINQSFIYPLKDYHFAPSLALLHGSRTIDAPFVFPEYLCLSALSMAALYGSREVADILMEAGASKARACKELRWSDLVWETALGNRESLSQHLQIGDLTLAARVAVTLNRPEALQMLIEAGADVNHIYDCNRTLAYFAASKGHDQCLQVLIHAHANINIIEDAMQGRRDALCEAMYYERHKCIDILLESPDLSMAAIKVFPFFLHLFKPSVVHNTIDSYQKNREYHTKVTARYEKMLIENKTQDLDALAATEELGQQHLRGI